MKLSFNYISSASLGIVVGFIVLAIAQLATCENIDINASITTCASGEQVNIVWQLIALAIAVLGISHWLYNCLKTND